MYLKSLQLIGFKSFVDKTTLEFGRGISSIVGPNGCGKSNVSDAIRWVLGEQSAKSIRGSEMTDVIFSGTDNRKPLGMAEVSITVGDAEKELGLEYNEVTITRRVFRDGTGEYLLNRTSCRLKDIHQLFMDTGIGRASYWLMEQGKMDRILASRPEDRRVIFEEAAGITKYKAQKHEALNKLELTNRNLEQLEPLLKEIKRQIISLQRQAGKARRYKELCAELKTAETKVARHRYDEFHIDLTNLQSQIDALSQQFQEAARAIEAEEANVVQSRAGEVAIERQVSELERKQLEIAGEIKRSEDHIRFNQNRIAELAADRESKTKELSTADERIRSQEQFVSSAKDQANCADAELIAAEKRFQDAQASAKQADAALHEADRKLTEIKNLAFNTEQRLSQLRNERAKIEQQRIADARRAERMAAEESTLRDRLEKIRARAQSFQNVLGPFQTTATQARSDFEQAEREIVAAIDAARAPESDRSMALDAVVAALQKLKAAIQAMFSAEIGWAQKRGEDESLAHELKETMARIEAVQWELKQMAAPVDDAQRIAEIEKLLADLTASEAQVREQLRNGQTERDALATHRSIAHETAGQEKLAWQSAQHAASATRERHDAAAARLSELREQIARWQSEVGRYEERVAIIEKEIVTARQAIEQWQAKTQGLEQDLTAKKTERDTAIAATTALEKELRDKRSALDTQRQSRVNLEVKLAERNKDLERLTQEISHRYQVDIASVTVDEADAGIDWTALQDKVSELQVRIEEMGVVNTEAIQEYDELEKRHTEITTQQEDLVNARDNLKEAIAKINATAKQLFEETFDKIAKNFQEMFTELFGGGRANLTLIEVGEGSEDVLDRGVEIMARPPGKQLQTIGLLSGGEKALTAIALIFAIYMVKPAPFCVFDELDAPLDESNVGRFCKVVQRFLNQSQFVVITHNKRTMSMADVLYGVTMQEAGVSKIVSVNFQKENHAAAPSPVQGVAADSKRDDEVLPQEQASAEPKSDDTKADVVKPEEPKAETVAAAPTESSAS